MSTLQERLHEVMTRMGWQHADLMRVSGQSSSVVSQWLGKSSKLIKSIGKIDAAQRIEAASGYCALWVATGQGPKHLAREPDASYAAFSAVPATWHPRIAALDATQREALLGAVEGILARFERGPP